MAAGNNIATQVAKDFLSHWHEGTEMTTHQAKRFAKACQTVMDETDNLNVQFTQFRDGSEGGDELNKMEVLGNEVLGDGNSINEGRLLTLMAFATKTPMQEGLVNWLAGVLQRCFKLWWWWGLSVDTVDGGPNTLLSPFSLLSKDEE
jgi:hypothetical protein